VGLFVHVLAAPGSGIASACCHLFPQRQLFHQIVCLRVALSVSLRFPKHLVCIRLVVKSLICTLYIIINNNIRICIIMRLV
jgi:hypothetical protein